MSTRQAALTEPAATALHALNLCVRALERPLPEATVLVIGGGAIGLLAALLMRSYGCRQVLMAEVNPLRRESAERHSGYPGFDPRAGGGPRTGASISCSTPSAARIRGVQRSRPSSRAA